MLYVYAYGFQTSRITTTGKLASHNFLSPFIATRKRGFIQRFLYRESGENKIHKIIDNCPRISK